MISTSPSSDSVTPLLEFVRDYPRLFVLTGAGISTASGIPDYRDARGEWKHSQPIQYQEFVRSNYARKRYWARSMLGWPKFASARPSQTHLALSGLERAGYVMQLVTQNVDGLHQRAGSRRVIDLHGRLNRVDCLECGRRMMREALQQQLETHNPAFKALPVLAAPDGDARLNDADFARFVLPECNRCGGMLKPAVVFFGESVPKVRVEMARKSLTQADALLVVGSSLMVFSGYRFCRQAVEQGKPIAAVNLGRTRADQDIMLKILAACDDVLPQLLSRLDLA